MVTGGRHQQAIFRRNPHLAAQIAADEAARRERIKEARARREAEAAQAEEPVPLPWVNPLCIFAAARKRFDFVVRGEVSGVEALHLAFKSLPLTEHGWDLNKAEVALIRRSAGFPIFRIWRHA